MHTKSHKCCCWQFDFSIWKLSWYRFMRFSGKQENECVASCAGGVTGLHSTGPGDGIFTWLVSWLLLLLFHLFTQRHTLAACGGVMALSLSVKIQLSVKSSYPVCLEFARAGCWCGLELAVWRVETGWLCGEWRRDWLAVWRVETGWLCGEWRRDWLAVWRVETGWLCGEWRRDWLVVWRMEKRLAGCVESGEETGWLCGEWRRDWLVVWRMEKRLAGCVENREETGWLCGEDTGWLSEKDWLVVWRRNWLVVWRVEKRLAGCVEKRLAGWVENGEETVCLGVCFDKGVDQLMEIHYCSSRYIIYA